MPTIFISAKLRKLIGAERLSPPQPSPQKSPNDWNAHLFPIYGRKCILVTNKETLYSFVRLDVLKKDLTDLPAFFMNSLFSQLKADGFSQSKIFFEWMDGFSNLFFRGTDNDKSVIGSMNDIIFQLKVGIDYRVPSLTTVSDLTAGSYINNYVHAPLQYKTPVEKLRQKDSAT